MTYKKVALSEDGRVYMDCYLNDWSMISGRQPKRGAVIIMPGGAYMTIAGTEGEPVALAFLARGFQAFVLHYSVGLYAKYPGPLYDAAKALAHVRASASEYGIDPESITLCGFSAGGHLAATLSGLWNDARLQKATGLEAEQIRPNALVLGYPCVVVESKRMLELVIEDENEEGGARIVAAHECVGRHNPPSFIFSIYEDRLVPAEQSLMYATALAKYDVPFELHTYQHGSHGCGLAGPETSLGADGVENKELSGWFDLCVNWLMHRLGKPAYENSFRSFDPGHRTWAYSAENLAAAHLKNNAESPVKRLSLLSPIEQVLGREGGKELIEKYMPDILAAADFERFGKRAVQFFVDSSGGALIPDKIRELSQELKLL